MQKNDFTTSIVVDQNAATAFNAITNFRAWWSEEIEGPTTVLNETFFYHYQQVHLCKCKLVEWIPGKKLVYLVTDNHFSFTKDTTEWIGTRLIFEIIPEDNKTTIVFTHEGLVPEHECYPVCHDAWTSYIQGSLHNLITTGTGNPIPKKAG